MSPSNLRKVGVALPTFLCVLSLSAFAQTNAPVGHTAPPQAFASAVEVVKNVVNVLFCLAVGVIGVLSYLQARRSLFTPIKTETFKLQLKTFEDLLIYFEKLRRDSVDKVFDLERMFHLNALKLLDTYAGRFFKGQLQLDPEKRNEVFKDLIGGTASLKDMEEDWELVDDYIQKTEAEEKPDITNPAVILANWQKYRHSPIEFTAVFQSQMDQLDHFIASPLLPAELKELLRTFYEKAHDNLVNIGEVLTEAAKELPEKYPSPGDVPNAQFHWLWNRYVNKRSLLTEERDKILAFVCTYLKIDTLLD